METILRGSWRSCTPPSLITQGFMLLEHFFGNVELPFRKSKRSIRNCKIQKFKDIIQNVLLIV